MSLVSHSRWLSSVQRSSAEYRVRRFLTHNNTAGIPQIYHFGQEGLHNILVIDLLGPSLEDLFDMCGRKFHIKTVCMAARQMVRDALAFQRFFSRPSLIPPAHVISLGPPPPFSDLEGANHSRKELDLS